jgi:hypothetical protein
MQLPKHQPKWFGDQLLVFRGVPSGLFPLEGEAASTWFTDWHAASDDASWVTLDEELALVEIGLVHRDDAQDIRNGFVTIEDPTLVDVRLFDHVMRLSAEEIAAQARAMFDQQDDD